MFIDPIGCLRILIVLNHFNAKHNMNDASSKIDCFQSFCCVISIFTANCSSDFFDKREWKKKSYRFRYQSVWGVKGLKILLL